MIDAKDLHISSMNCLGRMAVKLTKLSNRPNPDPYTDEDEQIDRLASMRHELLTQNMSIRPSTVYSSVLEKMSGRTDTSVINPGYTDSKTASSTNTPGELSCLNHHTSLKIAVDASDSTAIKNNKEACFEFLSADSMFLPTWDRSKQDMLKRWWNIDASCIICTTLIKAHVRRDG